MKDNIKEEKLIKMKPYFVIWLNFLFEIFPGSNNKYKYHHAYVNKHN
jgi:hypothetical protein